MTETCSLPFFEAVSQVFQGRFSLKPTRKSLFPVSLVIPSICSKSWAFHSLQKYHPDLCLQFNMVFPLNIILFKFPPFHKYFYLCVSVYFHVHWSEEGIGSAGSG